jgi:ADP-ribose pyrophosphatase
MVNKHFPYIMAKRETPVSKWLTLVERDVVFSDKGVVETFHSVRPYDYVSVLAVTRDNKIPLVKQYRPVLEELSLELPGGLIDTNKTPKETALMELREETGLIATNAKLLGVLNPDPGRLDNRFHCFFVSNAEIDASIDVESGIELVWSNINEIREMILDGRFISCPQISLIAMASLGGYIKELRV